MTKGHPPSAGDHQPLIAGKGYLYSDKDMRLMGRAVKEGWQMPKRVYRRLPRQMDRIMETSEKEENRIKAAQVLLAVEGQKLKARQLELGIKEGGQAGLNVTVNQYAGDGGTITNGSKEALDAAATFIRLMAGNEGDAGGAGVVCDEGGVQSPPTLALAESEPA